MDEAEAEHAEAKQMIAEIQAMQAEDAGYDEAVQALAQAIDHHVLEEREQIFLKAKYAALDLRGMVPALVARKKELQPAAAAPTKGAAKKDSRKKADKAAKEHA